PAAAADALRRSMDEELWEFFSFSGYKGDQPMLGVVTGNRFCRAAPACAALGAAGDPPAGSGLPPNRRHHRAAGVDRRLFVTLFGVFRVLRRMIGDAHAVMRNPVALGRNPGAVITRAVVLAAHGIGHFERIDEMVKHALIGRALDAVVSPVADR